MWAVGWGAAPRAGETCSGWLFARLAAAALIIVIIIGYSTFALDLCLLVG